MPGRNNDILDDANRYLNLDGFDVVSEDFVFDEDLIETQEDMYYYAVMALYSTYIAKKVEGADE